MAAPTCSASVRTLILYGAMDGYAAYLQAKSALARRPAPREDEVAKAAALASDVALEAFSKLARRRPLTPTVIDRALMSVSEAAALLSSRVPDLLLTIRHRLQARYNILANTRPQLERNPSN